MGLSVEVLSAIAASLSREDLGRLQHVTVVCRDLVARDFADFPLHRVRRLCVRSANTFDFDVPNNVQCTRDYTCDCSDCHYMNNALVQCTNVEEFTRRAKHSAVEELSFEPSLRLDRELVGLLSSVKAAWANGTVHLPSLFASVDVFETACGDAFLAKQLRLPAFSEDAHVSSGSVSLFELRAIRQCHALETSYRPMLQPGGIFEWLHRETDLAEPKTLLLKFGHADVTAVVVRIIEEFKKAQRPCPYQAEIQGRIAGGLEGGRICNQRTAECLQIEISWMGRRITMERQRST